MSIQLPTKLISLVYKHKLTNIAQMFKQALTEGLQLHKLPSRTDCKFYTLIVIKQWQIVKSTWRAILKRMKLCNEVREKLTVWQIVLQPEPHGWRSFTVVSLSPQSLEISSNFDREGGLIGISNWQLYCIGLSPITLRPFFILSWATLSACASALAHG